MSLRCPLQSEASSSQVAEICEDDQFRHADSATPCRAALERSPNLNICHIVALWDMGPAMLRPA